MKKLEKILGIVLIFALILKFNLITGHGILTVFSLTILSLIYFPFGFAFFSQIKLKRIFRKDSYQGLSALKIIGAFSAGIALSAVCMGILFRLQHYIGGELYLIIGLVSTFIVLIIALIKFVKNKTAFYTRIFKRIAIIGGFGLILAIIPDLTIIKIAFRNHPDYIKAYENYMNNPQDKELCKKMELENARALMSEEDFKHYEMEMKFKDIKQDSIPKTDSTATSKEVYITGTCIDSRDGKTYKTVKIGNQTWMSENLAYKTSSGCWAYNNNDSNVKTYGYLYCWETAKSACPVGWHLPSAKEWSTLISYLGGEGVAGGNLKSTSTWKNPNKGATNSSGFTALPGGERLGGIFMNIGKIGYWWNSTVYKTLNLGSIDMSEVGYICMGYDDGCVFSYKDGKKEDIHSVRCIKDK
jgi:uncharacterized protein (TIGR02145 family)